jgi:hypothetical protein
MMATISNSGRLEDESADVTATVAGSAFGLVEFSP